MFSVLSHLGIHDARELASYLANLALCATVTAVLWRTLWWRDGEP